MLLDTILRRLGAEEITLCDLSLREGLVLDYIARHRKQIAQADRYPDVRRRSVVELAERCNYWPEHAQQVARLSTALFDQTRAIHGLTDREREWLEYAAMLHDIGVHISYESHHKHSYYLDQERRPARVRARGNRDDRARRPLSSARHAQEAARRLRGISGAAPPRPSGRWRRSCGWRRASTAATPRRSPASSCTIAARTRCSSCGRRATPSSSCGRPTATPCRSSASSASRFASK